MKLETIDFKALFKGYEFPFSLEKGENGWYSLGFPFLYTDHDGIELFVKKREDGYFLISDDKWTLGVHSCFDKRYIEVVKRMIKTADYVRYNENTDEISAKVTEDTFAIALLEVVSIVIAVNYAITALRGLHVIKDDDE